jgi:membrane associated rhomboid family serine protease
VSPRRAAKDNHLLRHLQAPYLRLVKREPIFNVPAVILGLIAVFIVVHFVREDVLSQFDRADFDLLFAFIPARYDTTLVPDDGLPGGFGAKIWTFVSYAFIHGNWMHLIVNSIWLLPFGSAVARRFGAIRFLGFFAVTAAGGALAFLLTNGGGESAVVGASAAISGTMAAAMRFMFQRGGPLGFWRDPTDTAYLVPALPLSGVLREPRVMIFIIVWFGINLLFGATHLSIAGEGQAIAWQAHIGGFVTGLVLFSLFDPVPRNAPA